ncbi:MAG: Hypoxanthine-guanine phosphoribosyltransferase, partial [uncultured Rubrobacteraceae bacterium]
EHVEHDAGREGGPDPLLGGPGEGARARRPHHRGLQGREAAARRHPPRGGRRHERPHAQHRPPVRARLYGHKLLRYRHLLQRRRPHPEGPRRGRDGAPRPHSRGHRGHGPDPLLPPPLPARQKAGLFRDLRATHQAIPPQGRARRQVPGLRGPGRVRRRLRPGLRRRLPQPPRHLRPQGGGLRVV